MTFWLLLNSLGLAIVCLILFLLLRQMGFVLHRMGPVGARSTDEGPRVGENLSHHLPELVASAAGQKAKLVIFLSDTCGMCAQIRAGADALVRTWQDTADAFLVYEGELAPDEAVVRTLSQGLFSKRDSTLRKKMGAKFVPFAIVTDSEWNVVGKALVNEIAHLESLLELEMSQRRLNRSVSLQEGVRA